MKAIIGIMSPKTDKNALRFIPNRVLPKQEFLGKAGVMEQDLILIDSVGAEGWPSGLRRRS
jgi:hypothetical protein